MENSIKKLQDKLKIKFKNQEFLLQAITHKSFDSKKNYEKLEFLGDRVLGLTISENLIKLYPNEKVGILDKKLASLVNKNTCYEIGKKLKLQQFILVGNSNKKAAKIENKIISDCCESIIGAIYLDKGFEISKKFILSIWEESLEESVVTVVDSKTKLQEYSLKKFKTLPIYKVISNTGPRHKPKFKVAVKLKNSKFIFSDGSSKKNAEQSAAKEFLKKINQL
tara:strand:- start:628 stop:1296 length:669 start_codon:yes stop_codon:yes gene_type:complete